MNEIESRLQVNIQNCIPLSLTHTKHQTILCNTCVIYEDINRAKVFINLLNGLLCLLKISSITCISTASYSKSFNFFTGSLQTSCHFVIEYKICKGDISTLRSKFHSDSFTNAACSTCYKGCLTC